MKLSEFDDIVEVEVNDGHPRRKTDLRRLPKLCTRLGGELRTSLRGRRLFTLFALVNLVNYLDRGVVPGGSQEFNDFIRYNLRTLRPDVYLGILQSAFIFGFSVACLIFARLARRRSPFTLMGFGLGVWCVASVLAGSAKPLGSYTVLLLGRLLSGVGEASFVTVVPPLITETAPPGERGLWLALFYTAQPVGAGMGYVYGSVLATSKLGWQWAFYLEALAMAPLALACSVVPRSNASGAPNVSHYGARSCSAPTSVSLPTPTADKTTNRTNGADGTVGTKSSTSSAEGLHLEIERQLLSPGDSREDGEAIPSRGRSRRRRTLPGRRRVEETTSIEDGRRYEEGGDEVQEEGGRGLLEAGGRVHEEGQRVRRPTSGLVSGGGAARKGSSSLLGVEITRLEEQDGEEEEDEGMDRDALGAFFMGRDNEFTDSGAAAVASTKAKAAAGWLALPSSPRVSNRGDAGTPSEGRWMADGRGALGSINSADPAIPIAPGLPFNDAPDGGRVGGELLRDALEVVDRPVFCLVVLGAAATAAVTAGISTFGTGFVTSLELLSSETGAAATFGGMICAAGLLGTPAGGALIDGADPEGRLRDDRKLVVVLGQATLLMFASTVLVIMAMAQSSLLPFLILFFLGSSLLFATTAHASLAVMLAAPRHLRPLSLAINSVSMHALGDVPSPTVIGALKDALAPHCALAGAVGGSGAAALDGYSGIGRSAFGWAGFALWKAFGRGGEAMGVADGVSTGGSEAEAFRVVQEGGREFFMGISEACRRERGGLRLTLFIVSSWLLWTCLFFCLARAVQDTASAHMVQPPTWSDLGDLISKGLFGRLCCIRAVRKKIQKIPCCARAWRWRRARSGSTMPGSSTADEGVSQMGQPLIDRDSSFEM